MITLKMQTLEGYRNCVILSVQKIPREKSELFFKVSKFIGALFTSQCLLFLFNWLSSHSHNPMKRVGISHTWAIFPSFFHPRLKDVLSNPVRMWRFGWIIHARVSYSLVWWLIKYQPQTFWHLQSIFSVSFLCGFFRSCTGHWTAGWKKYNITI